MGQHKVSFRLAFEGIKYAFKSQINFKIHTFFAVFAMVMGLTLSISYFEWIILVFTILMVFIAEMINTSIESMTDLITTEQRQSAKIAKDVSAGMVLVTAITSIIIGLFIFLPKLISI